MGGEILKHCKLEMDLKENIISRECSFVCTLIQCVNIETVM